MDASGRHVRSRTSSTSSLRSSGQQHQQQQATSPPGQVLHARQTPDQISGALGQFSRVRCPSIEQLSGSSRSSSIPPTPAHTPNPHFQVSHPMAHEQLVAGIKQLRADEGYVDSTSFPATPAPSPFSPSPAQFSVFSPDQVAEGILRLREEASSVQNYYCYPVVAGSYSTVQPATPSTTPGLTSVGLVNQQLGVIPEHLAESIHQHLRCTDEGLESISNPATPVPTPISPHFSHQTQHNRLVPEQLAAGIDRLKAEEGMSSGGSSGFPSTPAPTPFCPHPGGIRPEDLAAGISRLSVIEEGDVQQQTITASAVQDFNLSEPSLSQYFSSPSPNKTLGTDKNFFDQLTPSGVDPRKKEEIIPPGVDDDFEKPQDASMLHSCRESRIDLTVRADSTPGGHEAELDVVEQRYEDVKSLQRRQSQEYRHKNFDKSENDEDSIIGTSFSIGTENDPFDNIGITPKTPEGRPPLQPPLPHLGDSMGYSTYNTNPIPAVLVQSSLPSKNPTSQPPSTEEENLQYFLPGVPITSPLPQTAEAPHTFVAPSVVGYTQQCEISREYNRSETAWIPCITTAQILVRMTTSTPGTFCPDRSLLTTPGIHVREDLTDPVRDLVLHYRGETEASKRNVLTSDMVTQDQNGLKQLIDAKCYRAAVNLTARLLQGYQQGWGDAGTLTKHTTSSLQIWYTRFLLMMKLNQYSVVEVEAEAFGDLDRPDLYFEYYLSAADSGDNVDQQDPACGSMVPFGFRLLLAELPQHLGRHHESLDRICAVLAVVDKILLNLEEGKCEDGSVDEKMSEEERQASLKCWTRRKLQVLMCQANCLILQKDFELAASSLEDIFELATDDGKSQIKSALGRVFLQLGDIQSATECFNVAQSLRHRLHQGNSVEDLMDKALLEIASNNFSDALSLLEKCNSLKPGGDSLIVNNMSVCLLYLGRLKEALSLLESNLTKNPPEFLRETQVLNLSTLYELESSYAGQKKQSLLDLMSQYTGDVASTNCLKF